MEFSHLISWICVILCLCYAYIWRKYSYWHRNQIPFIKPKFPFGNLKLTQTDEHISDKLTEFLRQRRSHIPMIGLYFFLRPVAFVIDMDLIRNILIKDFKHFENRATIYDKNTTPLSSNLFNLKNDEWKTLRRKITPTFTSSKIKLMLPTIVTIADELVECINTVIRMDADINVSEWLARFSTDIIGNCAFGLNSNCLRDPCAKFREMGKKIFSKPKISIIQRLLMMPFRNAVKPILNFIGINLHHNDVTEFFINVVAESVEYREKNQVHRNDFMDLMIALKNSNNEVDRLTVNEIASQAFLFWVAGFETTSTALTYCLYEIALDSHKSIQDKARQEIESILKKYNGNFCYEALNEMTYISQIISGTSFVSISKWLHCYDFNINFNSRNFTHSSACNIHYKADHSKLRSAQYEFHNTKRNGSIYFSL